MISSTKSASATVTLAQMMPVRIAANALCFVLGVGPGTVPVASFYCSSAEGPRGVGCSAIGLRSFRVGRHISWVNFRERSSAPTRKIRRSVPPPNESISLVWVRISLKSHPRQRYPLEPARGDGHDYCPIMRGVERLHTQWALTRQARGKVEPAGYGPIDIFYFAGTGRFVFPR